MGNRKKVYDRLSQQLEQTGLDIIERTLGNKGFLVFRERTFRSKNDEIIEPDFLVYDGNTGDLLVIDYKHTLAPVTVAQVMRKSHSLNEGEQGLKQVERYTSFLRRNQYQLHRWIGKDTVPENILGLLLFRWPMPIPNVAKSEVHIIDWASLNNLLSQEDSPNIQTILAWIKTRPDLKISPENLHFETEDIRVGEWTYKHQFVVTTS